MCRPLQDMCVSRMLVGCQMFQRLLAVLSEKLDGLMDLKVTLRDLVTHITKVTHTHTHTSFYLCVDFGRSNTFR